MTCLDRLQSHAAVTNEGRGDLARSSAERRVLFQLDVAETIEAEDSWLATQVIEGEEVPSGPADQQRVRLDASRRRFARLFHVIGADRCLTHECHLEPAHRGCVGIGVCVLLPYGDGPANEDTVAQWRDFLSVGLETRVDDLLAGARDVC